MMKNRPFSKFSPILSSVVPSWAFFKVESFSEFGRTKLGRSKFGRSNDPTSKVTQLRIRLNFESELRRCVLALNLIMIS